MRSTFIYSIVFIEILLALGCEEPDPYKELTAAEQDVYVANFDPSAEFASYRTYSIVDSISIVNGGITTVRVRRQEDIAVLNAINEEMQRLGFVKVAVNQNPDLGIDASRMQIEQTGLGRTFYGYDYWDAYYFWGYPGYSYYYPSFYYIYEINTGALMIDVIDLKNRNQQNNLNVVWNGFVMSGTGRAIPPTPRLITGVRSLFAQSPYLRKGNQ